MHGGPIKEGGIGSAARRKEDLRLTTGKGCYADDVNLPGQAYAAFVRSPHSHARIVAIDIAAAVAIPGVLAVLTGADAAADGLRPLQHNWRPSSPPDIALNNRDGSAQFVSPHLPLPADKVRFIGEAVAMVVASSAAVARDAAELVAVDYDPLPAVVDAEQAVEAGAPRLWEGAAHNICIDADVGDHAATEAAFARAEHVVQLKIRVQRITGVHMEPRAALCGYDAADGRYTLYTGSGGVVRLKNELAYMLNVEPQRVRVIVGDVGGNFGTRNSILPGVRSGGVGGAALRPPGEMDGDAQRGVPQRLSGARPDRGSGACARCHRPFPGDARFADQQCRRAHGCIHRHLQGRRPGHQRLRCPGRASFAPAPR